MADKINLLTGVRQDDVLLVDVSRQVQKSKVVREGYDVPAPKVDEKKKDFFIDQLEVVAPKVTPRVVSQSIRPGIGVTAGTVVDLVLALTSDVPMDIFDKAHRDLRERTVADVSDTILEDAKIREVFLKYERAADVPGAEKEVLTSQFRRANVNIDEASAETGFEAAYDAVRSALAFR